MQDRRTRPEHVKRNGQVFSWDSPPPDGHPGQPICCRCTSTPIFDDAEDFGLTPEEIAEDLAEQGLIEARQRAAVEERLRGSAQRKAEQTKANRAKGAKKAAKTRAKNKISLTEQPKAIGPGAEFKTPDVQPIQPDVQIRHADMNQQRKMVFHHDQQQVPLPEHERTELLIGTNRDGMDVFIDAHVLISRPKWSKTQIPAETLKAGKPPFQTGINVKGI